MSEHTLRRAAVRRLVEMSYAVIPIKAEGNTPRERGWQQKAMGITRRVVTDDDGAHIVVDRHGGTDLGWWFDNPLPNLAIVTGDPLGLGESVLVLDVDPRHGGDESLRRFGKLPETMTVATPHEPGRHFYFRHAPRQRWTLGSSRIAPGLDHRGRGGYAVAPPSTRPHGAYRWLEGPTDLFDLAEVPDWLAERLDVSTGSQERSGGSRQRTPGGEGWRHADAVHAEGWLVNACALLMRSAEGERNDLLTSLLTKGLFYAADGLLDPDTVIEALSEAAEISGLPGFEISATTTSITNYVARSIE